MGLLRAFGILLLVLLALAGAALWAAIDRTPRVVRGESLSPQSVAQAKALLAANDPRRLHSGAQREAVIPVALVDDAANHLAGRFARASFTWSAVTSLPWLPHAVRSWLAMSAISGSLS